MSDFFERYPNRTLCDVLSEMRKCRKTLNFSYLLGLIEETQSIGNRMESALADVADLKAAQDKLSKIRKEIKVAQKERDNLVEKDAE